MLNFPLVKDIIFLALVKIDTINYRCTFWDVY